jgi:hypothetical protein
MGEAFFNSAITATPARLFSSARRNPRGTCRSARSLQFPQIRPRFASTTFRASSRHNLIEKGCHTRVLQL